MGLLLLYEAAVVFVVTVLSAVAVKVGVDVYKTEKRKWYSDEVLRILNDAPLYYERLVFRHTSSTFSKLDSQNELPAKIDLSILLAMLNNNYLDEKVLPYGVSIDSLKKISGFASIESEMTGNSKIKKYVKQRIKGIIKLERNTFGTPPLDASMIFRVLNFDSPIMDKIFYRARLIESERPIDYTEKTPVAYLKEEETVFYDHNYPEDESVVVLTKKPTNQ